MYEFSLPMPYSKDNIDKLININKQAEKSKITSLYFSLPLTCELFTGFEQRRNLLLDKKDFDFWRNLAIYSIEKGFEVIYCLNSPRPLPIERSDFPKQQAKLHKLLNELEKIRINKLRIANSKLISYIHKNFPKFDLLGSTANDYKIIQEFQFLKQIHPYIKEIVPSHNANKNFMLLKNIQKLNFEVEIMVNEGCIQGCSNRFEHECAYIDENIDIYTNQPILKEKYYKHYCLMVERKNPILYLTKGNHIYPWELSEYEKIGITKFKLNGRDGMKTPDDNYIINLIETYLKGVDNIKNIENIPIIEFVSNSTLKELLKDLKVKDIKNYLPDIKHFVKQGYLCSSICGWECNYCYKNINKIQNIYKEKDKVQNQRDLI